MEATARGIHDFGFSFGDKENYLKIPEEIAYLKGRGKDMAKGVRHLAEKYGGMEFAMQVKNLEIPGYEPRGNYGMGLAYATAERGACHLRAWTPFSENPFDPKAMAEEVASMHNLFGIKFSMCICDFWGTVDTKIMSEFLRYGLGKEISPDTLDRVGERIWNLARIFNLKAGFKKEDDDLPERLKKDPLRKGAADGRVLSTEDFESMLQIYYRKKGWDSNGVPTAEKIETLGLSDLV
jgi:aldehyde:ferredoxin oxidoreductase